MRTDGLNPDSVGVPQWNQTGKIIVPAGDQSTMQEQTERTIFKVIALADVAMMVPAVVALERDWLAPVYYLEVILLAAIVAAAFVAVDHLSRLTPQR